MNIESVYQDYNYKKILKNNHPDSKFGNHEKYVDIQEIHRKFFET